MSAQNQQTSYPRQTYYVMNMKNDHWVKISDIFLSLEDATIAYSKLLKIYPFARLGGSKLMSDKGKSC